jgi:heat shock protein HslJ
MKKQLALPLVLGIAAVLALSACAGQRASAALTDHPWKLVSYGSLASPNLALPQGDTVISLEADGTISGNVGCNQFSGSYSVKGEKISFSQMVSTEMACEMPLMNQEAAAFSAFRGTRDFRLDSEHLTIYYDNGSSALVLEAKSTQ